jgi:hypothetical protein
VCLFSFSNVSNSGIFGTHFYLAVVEPIFVTFNVSICNLDMNIGKGSSKYLQGISFSQLTLAESTEIRI